MRPRAAETAVMCICVGGAMERFGVTKTLLRALLSCRIVNPLFASLIDSGHPRRLYH
jgi:hypothetical protein